MKKAWIKYAIYTVLIIAIGLLIIYFAVPGPDSNTDVKTLEKEIELMDRLTTALQSIMDDIDSSLEWNRRAKEEPPPWWQELKEGK